MQSEQWGHSFFWGAVTSADEKGGKPRIVAAVISCRQGSARGQCVCGVEPGTVQEEILRSLRNILRGWGLTERELGSRRPNVRWGLPHYKGKRVAHGTVMSHLHNSGCVDNLLKVKLYETLNHVMELELPSWMQQALKKVTQGKRKNLQLDRREISAARLWPALPGTSSLYKRHISRGQ